MKGFSLTKSISTWYICLFILLLYLGKRSEFLFERLGLFGWGIMESISANRQDMLHNTKWKGENRQCDIPQSFSWNTPLAKSNKSVNFFSPNISSEAGHKDKMSLNSIVLMRRGFNCKVWSVWRHSQPQTSGKVAVTNLIPFHSEDRHMSTFDLSLFMLHQRS